MKDQAEKLRQIIANLKNRNVLSEANSVQLQVVRVE